MELNKLADKIHRHSIRNGFYNNDNNIKFKLPMNEMLTDSEIQVVESYAIVTKIALIISKLSKAIEAMRNVKYANYTMYELKTDVFNKELFEQYIKDTMQDELTNALNGLLDLMQRLDIDIDFHTALKLGYNKQRPYLHGKEF